LKESVFRKEYFFAKNNYFERKFAFTGEL
jgi:hypothetical protein